MADYYNDNSGGFQTTNNYAENYSSSQPKTQLKNTITPVTIKQIQDSKQLVPDGEFTVNGVELNMVSFVGVIRNVVDNTSALTLTLEDGTASIDVRRWVEENAGDAVAASLPLGVYVYVTAALKEFSGKKNLQYATVKRIEDHNEVIYHLLSAINCHAQAQGLGGSKNANNGLFVSQPSKEEVSSDPVSRIFKYIHDQTPSMPEGVPVQLIAQYTGMMVDDVELHCGKLTEDGKIYNGYDDNGYLAV